MPAACLQSHDSIAKNFAQPVLRSATKPISSVSKKVKKVAAGMLPDVIAETAEAISVGRWDAAGEV